MRYPLIAALALCAVAAQALPQTAPKRTIPCKTPENAASCYWTHGRLEFCEWCSVLSDLENRHKADSGRL